MRAADSSWTTARLGDLLTECRYGTSSSGCASEPVPVVGIPHVKNGRVLTDCAPKMGVPVGERLGLSLRPGDILFARTNSRELVGCTGIIEAETDAVFASYLVRLRVDETLVDPRYLNRWLNSTAGRRQVERLITPAVCQANVNPTELRKNVRVPLPPLDEQRRIAATLATWDEAIEKTERLIAAKGAAHSDLLDRLLACADGRVVAVRELASEVSVRNAECSVELVLSVTNRGGFELPADRFSRRIASEDLRGYKLVRRGQFAYNPSRLNVGSIGRLDKWDIAALSPMYVVFELDDTVVDSDFFLHWLNSSWARGHISRSTQGSVRESVGFPDFGAIRMRLPHLTEQRRVAGILNLARREVDLLTQLKQQYTVQRQGLEQRLLTPPDASRAAS